MSHPFQITTSYKKNMILLWMIVFKFIIQLLQHLMVFFHYLWYLLIFLVQDLSNSDSRRAAETMVSHSTSHLPQVLPESNFIYYFDVKFKLSYLYLLSEDRFFIFKYFKYYHSWCFWFYYFCITEKQSNLYQ
jgi:hypothetical protein